MAAAANFRPLLALVALLSLSLGVLGDCVSYGVDYANGGAYYIDGSSNQYFSFITVFQGKTRCPPLATVLRARPVGRPTDAESRGSRMHSGER